MGKGSGSGLELSWGGWNVHIPTQSRNVYMPMNSFYSNSAFTVLGDVFKVITFLAIADDVDTLPVTFVCLNGATVKGSLLLNLANVMHQTAFV